MLSASYERPARLIKLFCALALLPARIPALLWSAQPARGQQPGIPDPGEVLRGCPDCGHLVVVPAGEFEMGGNDSPYEKPLHKVTITKPFAIGRREVTFDEWDACVSAGGCKYNPDD